MNTVALVSAAAGVCLAMGATTALSQTENDVTEYRIVQDVSYVEPGLAKDDPRQRCKLDLYHPAQAQGFWTVVWFHAGGLKTGSRYVPGELQRQGMAIAAVDYRLNPEAQAPAYLEDAAAAVAWIIENIATYGGDPERVVVAGASAGAYLTLMVGLDPRWLAAHGLDANRLAGLGALSGQAITHVTVREEQGGHRLRPVVDELAPLYHVRADAPPLLLVTGDRELELLGRYEENAYLWRMMKLVGHADTTLYEVGGHDHGQVEHPAHGILLRFIRRLQADASPDTP